MTATTKAAKAKETAKKPHLREFEGEVVSSSMNKTIVVRVTRRVPHATLRKIVRKTKKFYAHDENNQAKVGDKVKIQESRPLSKLKKWTLVEVIK
jgi:small subunit ribosomal protein S17